MLNYRNQLLTLLPASLLLTACATGGLQPTDKMAPVEEGRQSRAASSNIVLPKSPTEVQTQAANLGNAPVSNGVRSSNGTHTVNAGETLYRIAVNNGLKYQELAQWNNLDGFNIKVGQVLRLTPPATSSQTVAATVSKPVETATTPPVVVTGNNKQFPKGLKVPFSEAAVKQLPVQAEGGKAVSPPPVLAAVTTPTPPVAKPTPALGNTPAPQAGKTETKTTDSAPPAKSSGEPPVAATSGDWTWPTEGKVVRGFSEQNKGINIAGKMGQAVLAANGGKVVYSGSGLRGYGKLVIIRHDKTFLSAYAHNSALMVKEGQTVKKGQKIAEMGDSDADQVKLHFEIRELGKPVDPAKYLGNRP